jgi:hypothetical protein
MNKNGSCPPIGKMSGAQLIRFVRRMQWVRQQQKGFGERRFFRRQHAGLPATVGVPAQIHAAQGHAAQRFHGRLQPGSICCGFGRMRGTRTALLPKWEIATQDAHVRARKGARHGNKQWGLAICSRAMGEDQPHLRPWGPMQEAGHAVPLVWNRRDRIGRAWDRHLSAEPGEAAQENGPPSNLPSGIPFAACGEARGKFWFWMTIHKINSPASARAANNRGWPMHW